MLRFMVYFEGRLHRNTRFRVFIVRFTFGFGVSRSTYDKLKGSPQMARGRGAWLRGRGARAICGAEALLYGFDGLPCGSDSDVVWQIHVGTNGNIQSYPKHCVV